jgi:exosortase
MAPLSWIESFFTLRNYTYTHVPVALKYAHITCDSEVKSNTPRPAVMTGRLREMEHLPNFVSPHAMYFWHTVMHILSLPMPIESQTGSAVSPSALTLWHRTAFWRACVLAACVLLIYAPVLIHLAQQWWDEPDYSHGFLVPLFSAYVLWRRRDDLRKIAPRPSWTGMAILCASLAVLFIGTLGAELFLQRISMLGVLGGLIVWFWGWRMMRATAFPLLFLLLMIPLPGVIYYQIVFPLQILASRLATWTLHRLNLFPVLREGNVIVLPSTRLEVAEACSGLRSLFSLMAIAAMYAYLAEKNNLTRWILCLLVFPIAVAGNAGRVVFAAISAELGGASAVEGWSHLLSGLFLFFGSTLLLLICHAMINRISCRVASRRQV